MQKKIIVFLHVRKNLIYLTFLNFFCEGRKIKKSEKKMKRVKHRVNEGKAHKLTHTTQKFANKIKLRVIANG